MAQLEPVLATLAPGGRLAPRGDGAASSRLPDSGTCIAGRSAPGIS